MSVEPDVSKTLKIAVASKYSKVANEKWQELLRNQEVDWFALTNLANNKGLASLLYDQVRKSPSLAFPIETARFLERSYHSTATFNLFALHELTVVLEALTSLDIPVVVLKGAALLHSAYNSFALRPMVDLDLLIRFEYLEKTLEALANVGYLTQQPEPFHNYQGLFWNEVLLVSSGTSKMQVEVHWNLVDNPYYANKLTTEQLIARSQTKSGSGTDLRLLAPDDQIVHLCIHNTYHHRNSLERSFVDIAFVASHYSDEIRWDRLARSAIDNNMTLAVWHNLSVAANEWFAPIPTDILEVLEKHGYEIRERYYILSQQSEFLKLFRTLISVPGLKPKISFILGQLFPSREYLVWRYGKGTTHTTINLYLKRYLSGLSNLLAELVSRPSRLKGNRKKTPD